MRREKEVGPSERIEWRRVIVPFAVLIMMACMGAPVDNQRRFSVDTAANGAVDVRNSGVPLWADAGSSWTLKEDLRLGSASQEGPQLFSQIGAINSDSKGRIYVLDITSQDIRVFNPDGSWSHTLGRKGAGPGEFRSATGLAVGRGDTVWVVDPATDRYSGFMPEGKFLRSHKRGLSGFVDSWNGTFLKDGRYVDIGLAFPMEFGGIAGPQIVLQPVVRSAVFDGADSLAPLAFELEMAEVGGKLRPMPFFNGGIVYDVDASGNVWFALTREYRVYRRRITGDTVLSFSLSARAKRLSERDRDYVRRRMSARPEAMRDYLNALPEHKPILQRILTNGDGLIFVFADVDTVEEGTVVDLFKDNGEFIGRIPLPRPVAFLPSGAIVAHATKDQLLLLVTDSSDIPYVSRLRLVRAP